MTFDAFIKKYYATTIDYDGAAGVQCVDLAKLYLQTVFDISPFSVGSAKNYYLKFEQYPTFSAKFHKLENTPELVPLKGDLCVWNGIYGGGNGHVAIASGAGDTRRFCSYDVNWNGKAMKLVEHNYNGFLGVLRADDRSPITDGGACYPACDADYYSIADALISVGADGSYTHRRRIAAANDIRDYSGTAEQNTLMLELLKEGVLRKP
ncbi:MAG: CHAP domain-containing protein [Clostridia bacterium]|nr:CHAP domain-containing protein [Clostridia bacterium]